MEVKEVVVSTGSCFAVSPDGHLLTNKHVVLKTWELLHSPIEKQTRESIFKRTGLEIQPLVWVFFRKERYEASILHVSQDHDMAILKVEWHSCPYFSLSKNDKPPRESKVFAYGFPGAAGVEFSEEERLESALRKLTGKKVQEHFKSRDFEFHVAPGSVGRVDTEQGGRTWIQHNAPTNPGNSGGPLVSEARIVLGIQTSGVQGAQGLLQALGISQLREEIEKHVPGLAWR